MAAQEVLHNVEMWLPNDLLGDDFFLEEKKYRRAQNGLFSAAYDFDSSYLPSPVESATETEDSDEEDYAAHLTRHSPATHRPFRHSSPLLTHNKVSPSLACSPPSPLCNTAIDRLYAGAGRLTLNDDLEQQLPGLLGAPWKTVPPKTPPSAGGYHPLDDDRSFQLQQHHFLKQQLSAAWSRHCRMRTSPVGFHGQRGGPILPPSLSRPAAWSSHQPPAGRSGMRAVFLNGPGSRNPSSGTGVFLPRRAGSPTEPRKKPVCPTVLVPAKVVQALNLNLEEMCSSPHLPHNRHFPSAFFLDHEVVLNSPNGATFRQKKGGGMRAPPPPQLPVNPPEIHLPPEWTY